ncbi:MAG: tetratricopeptide repeat protein, partial [Elusimicrobia bacterium]|nr:tetratricopeptide repeat protein [Elusimicrobiota bacterium]
RLPAGAGRLAKALLAVLLLAPAVRAGSFDEVDGLYRHRGLPEALERSDAELEARVKASPDDAAALWRLARGLVREGERARGKDREVALFSRAETLAGRSVALSSTSADAWFWYGVALGKQGEARGMMHALFMIKPFRRRLETALRLDPRHAPAHHALGELLWQLPSLLGGSREGARRELEAALADDPSYTAPYSTLAEVYLAEGRRKDAERLLPRILAVKEPVDPADYDDDVSDLRKALKN